MSRRVTCLGVGKPMHPGDVQARGSGPVRDRASPDRRQEGVALMWRWTMGWVLVLALSSTVLADSAATFDDLTLAAESYWNGSDESGGFTSGTLAFNNTYTETPTYIFWGGWAYSNTSDTTTFDIANQYSAITGAAQSGSNYAVGYVDTYTPTIPTLTLPETQTLGTAYITNTTYAYLSMRDGDPYGFSKKFGGDDGTDADWFLLTITGKNTAGQVTGTVEFYLADYRFENSALDYLVSTWTPVDLSTLGAVKMVEFTLSSSDSSDFGINTPTYFAMDTVSIVPEPATLGLLGLGMAALIRSRRQK